MDEAIRFGGMFPRSLCYRVAMEKLMMVLGPCEGGDRTLVMDKRVS